MKLWIISDLHRDFGERFDYLPPEGTDVIVAAGDIQDDNLLVRLSEHAPVVFVAGNHSFYNRCYPERMAELRALASGRLHVLENDAVVIGGVRFLGCTLWTDYDRGNPLAMDLARRSMNDHRLISWQKRPVWQRFRPEEALELHKTSRKWLETCFSERFDGKTVVVTHHAPSERSIAPKYAGDPLNHAYYSALDAEIEEWQPSAWIHGHMHNSASYKIGITHIINNPRGYGAENPTFNPKQIVEI